MKLYYAPGTSSLAPLIALNEAGLDFTTERVHLHTRKTDAGADYLAINPKGQVPALETDSGKLLTENVAILSFVADCAPTATLVPEAGGIDRYRLLEWLSFVGTELHKNYSPLFNRKVPDESKDITRRLIGRKLEIVDRHLADHAFLLGDDFTPADAYLFAVTGWSEHVGIDLAPFANLGAFIARVAERPSVHAALGADRDVG